MDSTASARLPRSASAVLRSRQAGNVDQRAVPDQRHSDRGEQFEQRQHRYRAPSSLPRRLRFPEHGPVIATFSGNITFSGQSISTGTSAPASAGGQFVVMGTIASPTLANTGQAFLYNTMVNGAILEGDGSTNDVSIVQQERRVGRRRADRNDEAEFSEPSSGTCSSGLGLMPATTRS